MQVQRLISVLFRCGARLESEKDGDEHRARVDPTKSRLLEQRLGEQGVVQGQGQTPLMQWKRDQLQLGKVGSFEENLESGMSHCQAPALVPNYMFITSFRDRQYEVILL